MKLLFLLLPFFSYSQDTIRKLVIGSDTLIALHPAQLKTLNQQLSLLSEYKTTCDSLIIEKDSTIQSCIGKNIDLMRVINFKDEQLQNNHLVIADLEKINKNTKKKGLKTTIYSGLGAAVIGLIVGILVK